MNKQAIILSILMLVAIMGAVMLVNQNQDARRGATIGNTNLLMLPDTRIDKNVNDTFPVQVVYHTTDGKKVDGVQTKVCYGSQLELNEADITVNTAAGFSADKIVKKIEGSNCTIVVVLSNKSGETLVDTATAFTMNFKAILAGEGTITQESVTVTGDDASSPIDKLLAVTSAAGTSYRITEPVENTEAKLLKFRMSFYGIGVSAMCAEPSRMPLTVTVRANDGTSQVYTNVIPTKAGVGDTLAYYDVRLRLTDINLTGNFSIFVKGPKHLQSKFGRDGQNSSYDQADGELAVVDLTNDETTTKMYNFENNPLLSGDVTGESAEVQDGVIDGQDFSYVKGKSIDRTEEVDGGYMLSDLNGNCKMESQDLAILMLSLKDKQEQLY